MICGATDLPLSCPACDGRLVGHADLHRCAGCGREFPTIFGIPDLRLRGDRYLDLDAERAKARHLAERAETDSFEALLQRYYLITDDVTPALATRYSQAARSAPARLAPFVSALATNLAPGARVLDLGCGTGGALVAGTHSGLRMVGIDIALRWLVICRKRLRELSMDVPLICADASHLPFRVPTFDAALAVDLFDHVEDSNAALGGLRAALRGGAPLCITGANPSSPGPELSTGIWGLGLLPAALRRQILERILGLDALRHVTARGYTEIVRQAAGSGFEPMSVRARRVVAADPTRSLLERSLMHIYRRMSQANVCASALLALSPSYELWLRQRGAAAEALQAGAAA